LIREILHGNVYNRLFLERIKFQSHIHVGLVKGEGDRTGFSIFYHCEIRQNAILRRHRRRIVISLEQGVSYLFLSRLAAVKRPKINPRDL